jgi:hypothetical protein
LSASDVNLALKGRGRVVAKHSLTPKWGYFRIAGDTVRVPIPDAERRLQTVSESVE